MRRRRLTVGSPGIQPGKIAQAFTSMYNAVPSEAERQAEQAQIGAQRAQADLYSAKAANERADYTATQRQQQGREKIADLFSKIDVAGENFHLSGAHPSQQHRTDAPEADLENSLGEYAGNELREGAIEAMRMAMRAGMKPDEANQFVRNGIAAYRGSQPIVQGIGYASDPKGYTLGVNDAISPEDREGVAARNQQNNLGQIYAEAAASPLTVGEGDMVVPGAGDPRGSAGPIYGRDTASTAEAGLINRAAGGEQLNDQQAAIAGADGSAGPNKQRIALRGPNGDQRSGYFDPGAGTYHFATGERVPEGWQAYNQPQPQGSNEELGFESSELKSTRQEILNRRSATKQAVATVDEISGRLQQAEDPAQIVGIVGSASGLLNDMAAQAKAAMRLTGTEIEAPGDAAAYEGTFRELGIENRQMQAAFLDLAYSIAQSRESGRLTEADISRALRTVGANAQDPVAMSQVLQSARNRLVRNYQIYEGTAREMYGDRLNVDPWRPKGGQPQGGPAGASPAPGGGQGGGGASGQPGTGGGNGGVPVIDLDGNRIE